MAPQDIVLPRAELEAVQWHKLSGLLERCYTLSPFYRDWLDKAGAQPHRIKSLADFRSAVPLMRKEDVLGDQALLPPYGQRLCVPREAIVQVASTGGTSGKGKEIYALTANDLAVVAGAYARGCRAAGIVAGDVVAMTFPMSMSAAPLWIYEAFRQLRANIICVGPYDTRTRLLQMKEFGAKVLVATPSYLESLAAAAHSEFGWDVAEVLDVDIILTATESFSIERIGRIEAAWGAKVHEWYGATQRVIAFNGPEGAVTPNGERGILHHLPDVMMLETIDPKTQQPVAYGEEGEVVATFLDAEASPLLRFATGDRVRLMPGIPGLSYDGYESGTIARYDDMIKVRGVNIWPATTDAVFFREGAVANYVGVASSRDDGGEDVVVQVEFLPETAAGERKSVIHRAESELKSILGIRINVVETSAPLPRFQDSQSKARRWRDERRH